MDTNGTGLVAPSKRIAVIGAGAAGLVAIKTLRSTPEFARGEWEIVCFERRHALGGIWLPAPTPATAPTLPQTPLYDSLTTNLPHPIMAFRDFAFPPSTPLFPPASTVLTYLETYADAFDLREHIQFNVEVEHLGFDNTPVRGERDHMVERDQRKSSQWTITTRNIGNGVLERQGRIDTLILGNGRHNLPHIPGSSSGASSPTLIPGLAEWIESKHAIHAMYYRRPLTHYQRRTILVVGNGSSAKDLAPEIASVAKVVWRSVRSPPPSCPEFGGLHSPDAPTTTAESKSPRPLLHNQPKPDEAPILFCSTITSLGPPPLAHNNGGTTHPNVFLADGSALAVDYIVFATGYDMTFPFLPETMLQRYGGIEEDHDMPQTNGIQSQQPPLALYQKSLSPLLYHLIPSSPLLPLGSLFILGLPRPVVPFPLDQAQCHLLTAILQGTAHPSRIMRDKNAGSGEGIFYGGNVDPERETDPQELSRRYHLFAPPNDGDQFDYREFLIGLSMSTADAEKTRKEMEHMVPAWQRTVYENKFVLRATWRDLERRGVAKDVVKDVGEGEDAELQWVELMERLLRKGD